jgi:YggT family protein
MPALIAFVFLVLDCLIQAVIWLVIANAIVSWLIAFDVINMRNRIVYSIVTFLDRITAPILRPLRRVIPPLGGMDITPVILIIVLGAAEQTLLPALERWLISLTGGGLVG